MYNSDSEICGNCKYHVCERKNNNTEWYCCNKESEYYDEYTEYTDSCDNYEERN